MAGEIYLFGTLIPGGIMPTHRAQDGIGGKHEVANTAARNALSPSMLTIGMFVTTQNDGVTYRLTTLTPSAGWTALASVSFGSSTPADVAPEGTVGVEQTASRSDHVHKLHTLGIADIATGTTSAINLQNTEAANSSQTQSSPALEFEGRGWKTSGGSVSQTVKGTIQLVPKASSSTRALTRWIVRKSVAGDAYTDLMSFGEDEFGINYISRRGSAGTFSFSYDIDSSAPRMQLSSSSVTINSGTNGYTYVFSDSGTVTSSFDLLTVSALCIEERTSSGDTNVAASDYFIAISNTAAPRTVTLPSTAVVTVGRVIIVKDTSNNAGTNNITIARNGASIDGALADAVINTNRGIWRAIYTSSGWETF